MLDGFFGDDTLNGGNGNDILNGGGGANTLNGGNGNDTASYANTLGATVDLRQNEALDGRGNVDRLFSIENVIGSIRNDEIRGDSLNNRLEGRNGRDELFGYEGNDTLEGGDDNDLLRGGNGSDVLEGQDGDDNLVGGSGSDTLLGSDGIDRLWGEAGSDVLDGGEGNDFLRGWKGNDTLTGGEGNDVFVIESGNDGLDNGLDTFKDFNILEDAITFRGDTRNDPTTLALSISESLTPGPNFGKTILFGEINGNSTPIAILENVPSTTDASAINTLPANTWRAVNDFLGIE